MAIPLFKKPAVNKNMVVNGNETWVTFLPCGVNPYTGATYAGADSTTSVPKGGGVICTGISLADIPIVNLFTENMRSIGKSPVKFSSGAQVDPFDFNIEGGDIRTLKILAGLNPSSTSINAYKFLPDMGKTGHMIVRKYQPALGIVVSYLIPDLSMMIPSVAAGGTVDTRAEQVVQFYKPEDGDIWGMEGNKTFSWGYWKDNAVNATAPNGILFDFVIGTGNSPGTTSPVPLLINDDVIGSTASNYRRYFFGVYVNGVLQSDAQVTYTVATRTLTFATAPANGASLLALYINDWSSVFPEVWANDPFTTTVTAEEYPWYSYA
jgi:hypothetical protein